MKTKWTPLLSADEERDLAGRIKAGDQAARRQFVLANLGLVVDIARRFRSKANAPPLDDLIQEGNLGLMRASEDFDPVTHGCRFATYAEIWIRSYIHRAIFADRTIRLPEHYRNNKRYRNRLDEVPRAHSFERGRRLARGVATGQSTVVPLMLDLALRQLNPVEAWVIRERYGLVGYPSIPDMPQSDERPFRPIRSYAALERDCGLSGHRIRQVEQAALEKLRRVLEPIMVDAV